MSITINGDGDINATGNDIELNPTGTTDVTLAVGGGSVGVGTASPDTLLEVSGASGNASIKLARSDAASTNDDFGSIVFENSAGTTLASVRGVSKSGNTEAGITFGAGGGDATRMTLDNSGNLGIGTESPTGSGRILHLNGSSTVADFHMTNSTSGSTSTDGFILRYSGLNAEFLNREAGSNIFYTSGVERMRLEGDALTLTNTKTGVTSSAMVFSNAQSSGAYRIRFDANSATRGDIRVTTSSVAYNTTSDARLKENVVDLTGAIDRVNQIPVHRFNFIANPDTTVDGFLAHEVQDIVPEAITGTHNEVDEDGNPVYQGIDQSKLVPLLTAALQEALSEIADLKTRVAALETP